MSLLSRFNIRALLLLAGAIVVLQQLRPWLSHLVPSLAWLLGVAPNLVAGIGLPFTWVATRRASWREHWQHCLVSAVALGGYEFAQGAGLVPAHSRFDASDFFASIVGTLVAGAIGWQLRRRWAEVPIDGAG
jgi:hypothetical protein